MIMIIITRVRKYINYCLLTENTFPLKTIYNTLL